MHIVHEFRLGCAISSIYKDAKNLYIITNNICVYHYNTEYTLVYKHTFDEASEQDLHDYTKSISISKNSSLVLPTSTQEHAKLYEIENSLNEKNEGIEQDDEIESSLFSQNNKLLILGNKSGRCNVYNVKNYSIAFELKPRPDYINTLALSKTNRYLLSSAHNKSVNIFDLSRAKNKLVYRTKAVTQSALFLNNPNLSSKCNFLI